MSIQQPRRFVTTDQGHADVLNGPIDTLYANDQELAAQVENIKKDPAGNGVASKEALDNHASNTEIHVTAAKQAVWSATEGNAKKYTDQYAAPKQHSHPASDLPSASTQARGIVQLNTSTGSTATDQAATPSAVKAANDRANEAYSRADQAFTQASDLKSKVANAITGKGGSANSGMTGDQLAASILNMPTKRFASGTISASSSKIIPDAGSVVELPATATVRYDIPSGFNITRLFLDISGIVGGYLYGWFSYAMPSGTLTVSLGSSRSVTNEYGTYTASLSGNNTLTIVMTMKSTVAGTGSTQRYYEHNSIQWWAYE
ncbi:tail fiber protein [Paenibacillus polymyxa]|uniref:tail fiber protein n=1 Tax=Paenibacillus TaxID=44249 RepID=UPI002024A8C2|nr:tail fiber protein [Paenibacillus polymyxa]URJ40677.1 phage tail protein [Paenibacillus polymyxa]